MKKNKKTILFLVKFFATYFVLFYLYSTYLHNTQQKEPNFLTSPITTKVAKQTIWLLDYFGYNANYQQHENELSVKLFIENNYVARVIEGCNSISIIILFIAFIIAFSGPLKETILFASFGSLLIYTINLFRIAFLTTMIYAYPKQQDFLHSLVFPAIIYGTTFLLWVLWVQKFSNYKK